MLILYEFCKTMPKNKSKEVGEHVSPLNQSVLNAEHHDETIRSSRGRKNRNKENKSSGDKEDRNKRGLSKTKLAEESALTALLFGGGGGRASSGAWADDDDDDQINDASAWDDKYGNQNSDDEGEYKAAGLSSGDLFAIDRSGEEVQDDSGADIYERRSDSDSDDGDDDGESEQVDKASMQGAAWQDPDESDSDSDASEDSDDDSDNNEERISKTKKLNGVSLVNGPHRLKKLRRYRGETDPLSVKEYELRLRERFMSTTSVAARTDWADIRQIRQKKAVPITRKRRGYGSSSEDESEDEEYNVVTDILESNGSLFQHSSSGLPLPPTLLDVVRTRDGNICDPNNSVVNAVQFHPGSDEEGPLLMTAGMDKMLRFFRIDGEENPKIHGIHFPTLPITSASFLGDSGSVVMSGRRPFFYVYDAISGNIQKISSIVGRKERSLEKFVVSPGGDVIAFVGNDGYIILVDGKSRQWISDLKMNGSVRAITFSEDGEYIMGSGSDGDVYK